MLRARTWVWGVGSRWESGSVLRLLSAPASEIDAELVSTQEMPHGFVSTLLLGLELGRVWDLASGYRAVVRQDW